MTDWVFEWGELAEVAVSLALFGYLFWAFPRRKRVKNFVPDSPADDPYRIYTTAHDLTIRASDVPAALAADPYLVSQDWILRDQSIWQRKAAAARDLATSLPASLDTAVDTIFAGVEAADWAICLLVDHSGSMRDDPILHTAAAVRRVSDRLVATGAQVSVLGFSTVGWKGGKARQDWLWNGQPKRPGRLCALLHIEYQIYGERLSDDDWAVMLHPDVLRENVDGEALAWAASSLSQQRQPRKLLVVLSDGASVDDSTLTYNGPSLLERHLLSVIGRIEQDGNVILAAIGIGFAVDRYYPQSCSVTDLAKLPAALVGSIQQAVQATINGKGTS